MVHPPDYLSLETWLAQPTSACCLPILFALVMITLPKFFSLRSDQEGRRPLLGLLASDHGDVSEHERAAVSSAMCIIIQLGKTAVATFPTCMEEAKNTGSLLCPG